MQGVKMFHNNNDYNITIENKIINSTNIEVILKTSGSTTIRAFVFSSINYDKIVLDNTYLDFYDAGIKSTTGSAWAMLNLGLSNVINTNIMVGMCSLSLGQSNNLVYSFNNGSSTFTGTTSTIYIEMGYFGTKIRSCPASFPYYSPSNSLCYDVCPSRSYTNTVSSLCLSCTNVNCLTCSSDLTTCLSCDSITDRRTLNGTTCSCQTGYYGVAGTSVCSPCFVGC